jgi:hypothetical protein
VYDCEQRDQSAVTVDRLSYTQLVHPLNLLEQHLQPKLYFDFEYAAFDAAVESCLLLPRRRTSSKAVHENVLVDEIDQMVICRQQRNTSVTSSFQTAGRQCVRVRNICLMEVYGRIWRVVKEN